MLQIAICDDEAEFIEVIDKQVYSFFDSVAQPIELTHYYSGIDLLQKANENTLLYLLDIDMPDLSGIETALILRKRHKLATIIFVSHDTEAVFETFRVSPLRFVRKNHLNTDLSDALQAFYSQYSLTNQDITLHFSPNRNEIIPASMQDIVYLSSEKHYVVVHCINNTITVREKLDYYERLLSGHCFTRIGKSFLINISYVDRLLSKEVLLKNGLQLPISRDRIEHVREEYMDYIRAISTIS